MQATKKGMLQRALPRHHGEAERLGAQSVCGKCNVYAAFSVIGSYPKMNVRCRKCGNEWLLDA